MQLCTDLTTRVQSAIGDTVGTANKAALASVLANPAVSQVLTTAPVSSLLTTVNNATAVPDYCGLVLALPTVPVPGDFTQLPASVMNRAVMCSSTRTPRCGHIRSSARGPLPASAGSITSHQLIWGMNLEYISGAPTTCHNC